MKFNKTFLRNKFLLQRKKKYLTAKKFDFNLIFKLITKHFYRKKITSAIYFNFLYYFCCKIKLYYLESIKWLNFLISNSVIKWIVDLPV